MRHDEEKKKIQSTKSDPEMAQLIELADNNIKAVTKTAFHMFKTLEERLIILQT